MKRDKALAFIKSFKNVREIVSDDVAKENVGLYPVWVVGKEFEVGDRVDHEGKLYKVVQAHTAQESWVPNATPALFEPLDVVNKGTFENPIIAAAGMAYFKDKYYFDETDGNTYLCTRQDTDEGTVLHFMPSALVGVYFELAE